MLDYYVHTPQDIKEEINQRYGAILGSARESYYKELDPTLLKEGADPKMAVEALMLLLEVNCPNFNR